MYPVWAFILSFFVIVIWLGILTYLILEQRNFFYKLFPKDKGSTSEGALVVQQHFNEVLATLEKINDKSETVNRNVRNLAKEGLVNLQKIGIMRYNPYKDTGGDQSFSLAMLDGKDTGILITSLHSRAGTRIYAKIINNGKSDLELSKEETAVLEEALKK